MEGSISERGRIALEAKIFSDIIRKLPDSDSDVIIFSDEHFNTTINVIMQYLKFREEIRRNIAIYLLLKKISTFAFPNFL